MIPGIDPTILTEVFASQRINLRSEMRQNDRQGLFVASMAVYLNQLIVNVWESFRTSQKQLERVKRNDEDRRTSRKSEETAQRRNLETRDPSQEMDTFTLHEASRQAALFRDMETDERGFHLPA